MPVINLYTMEGCPKCKILHKKCAESPIIANSNFKEIIIDPNNTEDTDVQLLIEKGITSMPVLLVDDDFMTFDRALQYLS